MSQAHKQPKLHPPSHLYPQLPATLLLPHLLAGPVLPSTSLLLHPSSRAAGEDPRKAVGPQLAVCAHQLPLANQKPPTLPVPLTGAPLLGRVTQRNPGLQSPSTPTPSHKPICLHLQAFFLCRESSFLPSIPALDLHAFLTRCPVRSSLCPSLSLLSSPS